MGIPMNRLMVSSFVSALLMLPTFAANTADLAHDKAGFSPQSQDAVILYLNRGFYKFPDIQ